MAPPSDRYAEALRGIELVSRTMIVIATALCVLGAAVAARPAVGVAAIDPPAASDLVQVRVLADVETIGPGQTLNIAVAFKIAKQWHTYWKNPGVGALPPRIDVKTPPGYKVGEIRWPRPLAHETTLGIEYIYENEAVLFVPVTAPDELDGSPAEFTVDVDYAVCDKVCMLGRVGERLRVSTSTSPVKQATGDQAIRQHQDRLPKSLKQAEGGFVRFDGTTLTLEGPMLGHKLADFFPEHSPGVTYSTPKIELDEDRFHIEVNIEIEEANALGKPMVLAGLVLLGREPEDPSYEFSVAAK